jgi:hypothetical protein
VSDANANEGTTMTTQREWTEIAGQDMAQTTGRLLYVEDGQLGHYAPLAEGEFPSTALKDYVAGYDAPRGTKIGGWWHLYEDGLESNLGEWEAVAGG